jgi:hypothetical protein
VGTIRIEPEDPIKENLRRQCQGTNRLLHGYVYEDEFARGVYFVEWCDGEHPNKSAFLSIGLGAYSDGTSAADRRSVCIEWRADGMRLAEEPARDRPELLGAFIPRNEALKLANIDHVWHVADHIVVDDPRVEPIERWLAQV